MLKNYFTIALRTLRKHPGYAAINVVGLAVGIACCLLMLLYVQDELRYDRFHENADRIYRVTEVIAGDGGGEHSASAPLPVGATLAEQYPHLIETAVRFFDFQAPTLAVASSAEVTFNEPRFFFADATVFQAFDFPLLQGDPATALAEPNTAVLTRAAAQRYFGDADPVGRTLRFEDEHDLTVTGVLAELPTTMHFQFDFLASFASLERMLPEQLYRSWYWNPAWTYVVLHEHVTPDQLEAQFPRFVDQYFPDIIKADTRLRLQPLTDIHLHSALDYEIEPNSSMANVYIFSAIALFILLIACINFMNLATARSAGRAKEVGMRKVLGAHRGQLIRQFLAESVLLTVLALLLAVVLVQAALPAFNAFTGKALALDAWQNPAVGLGLASLALVVGLLAGSYPAFVLSAFQPVRVLKSAIRSGPRGLGLRKTLVVAQFGISILLIASTLIAYDQLDHLLNADIGFDQEQVVMLPVTRSPLAPNYETFKDELLKDPRIADVTALEEILGAKHQTGNYQWEGMTESRLFPRLFVRHDFVQTFGIELAAGRAYDETRETDEYEALLINEAMARQMGWTPEEALGKRYYWGNGEEGGAIAGVVKDFHFTSLHQPINPLVLDLRTDTDAFNLFIKYVAVRVAPGDVSGALAHVQQTWEQFVPTRPFAYFFLDQNLDQLYRAERYLGTLAGAFAGLAILVACLGLFGLAAFTAQQRTKEIGIRKVLGASTGRLVVLLTKDFLGLVVIAFVLAAPAAYLLMQRWLSDFASRIAIEPAVFVIAGVLALAIALLTVSYQAIRTALTNPVKSLRYE